MFFPLEVKDLGVYLNLPNHSRRVILNASIDSRKTKEGDLFFALAGNRLDGHLFLRDVAQKGAAAAIVSENYLGEDFGMHLFKVPNVRLTLQELARLSLDSHRAKVVGITGSLGKTTTKDFTTSLLKSKFLVNASEGTNNSQLTLPLTIINRKIKEEILVLEMGMSEEGELANLVRIAPPDIALITSVALVHACFFNDLEHIARAKAEIFSHPNTKVGIYNAHMPYSSIARELGNFQKISFDASGGAADYTISLKEGNLTIFYLGKAVGQTSWSIPGRHNLQNYLGAVAIAHQLGLSWEEICKETSKLVLPAMRLQRIEKNGILFINDAYNANQDSMCAALESLPAPKPGRKKIAVLGDMRELGKFSEECHKEVAKAALEYADRLFCLGEGCRPMVHCWKKANKPVDMVDSIEELIDKLRNEIEQGDVVLLKGSKVHALWQILEEF